MPNSELFLGLFDAKKYALKQTQMQQNSMRENTPHPPLVVPKKQKVDISSALSNKERH
jgi:hypothetical protein